MTSPPQLLPLEAGKVKLAFTGDLDSRAAKCLLMDRHDALKTAANAAQKKYQGDLEQAASLERELAAVKLTANKSKAHRDALDAEKNLVFDLIVSDITVNNKEKLISRYRSPSHVAIIPTPSTSGPNNRPAQTRAPPLDRLAWPAATPLRMLVLQEIMPSQNTPFRPWQSFHATQADGTTPVDSYQSISSVPKFARWSAEEMRLDHYIKSTMNPAA